MNTDSENVARKTIQPLEGLRVLDLSTLIAAPLGATLLGDFGADVVKVEVPGSGDIIRGYPPRYHGEGLHWKVAGRNKRSVSADLHTSEGRSLVRALGGAADVIITNFRLPTLAKWGLDYEHFSKDNPAVMYLHLTGFGRTGPWADRPGFARVAEAFAGLTGITGEAGEEPVFPGYPVGDGVAGLYSAFSVLLALEHRNRTGRGQLIDLALYEPMLRLLEDMFTDADLTGQSKERQGNAQHHSCPNGLFPTRDQKWLVLPVSTENMWDRLRIVMDDPLLKSYGSRDARIANRAFVEGRVAAFTRKYSLDELLRLLGEAGVACGPVNTATDVIEHDQVIARKNLVRVFDQSLGTEILIQGVVPAMSDSPGAVRRSAPAVGEHNEEVVKEWLGNTRSSK